MESQSVRYGVTQDENEIDRMETMVDRIKILVIGSINNHGGKLAPFITEQAEALGAAGCEVEYFGVKGKGVIGYLGCLKDLKLKIEDFNPDVIHAHFGLCGLLACLQRKVPVVTTFHGCDINNPKIRKYSYPALWLSKYVVFVSKDQAQKVVKKGKQTVLGTPYQIIPCGVDTTLFYEIPNQTNVLTTKKILFGSSFDRPEKKPELARKAVAVLEKRMGWKVELIPLKGFTREQVVTVINQCDCGMLTSLREGSPQFTKEVLACHKPIVCTKVGDVEEQFDGVEGAFIAESNPNDVADKLQKAIEIKKSKTPQLWAEKYDNNAIADKLMHIYNYVINKS